MESMLVAFNTIIPMFLQMGAGVGIRRTGMVSEEFVSELNKLIFNFLLPVMIFQNISTAKIEQAFRPGLFLYVSAALLTTFFCSYLIVPRIVHDLPRCGVTIQAMFRSNYTVIGIPMAQLLVRTDQMAGISVLAAVTIPIYNILAVLSLEPFSNEKASGKSMLVNITKNPLIISSLAGVISLALHISLPSTLQTALNHLKVVASPLSLLSLGMSFRMSEMKKNRTGIAWNVLFRLVVVPGVFLIMGYFMNFRGADFVAMIGVFATPVSVPAYIMATRMGGDAEFAACITMSTMLISCLTLFFWISVFHFLRAF